MLLDIVPAMYLAPGGPPVEASEKALRRFHTWNHAQRWSHRLGVQLESHVAFLKQEDLTLAKLLEKLPIPNRANAMIGPAFPPYFYTLRPRSPSADVFRGGDLAGTPLQQRVANGWLSLFKIPPPPSSSRCRSFSK